MSGVIYLLAACALGALFLRYAVRIYVDYSDALARRTFRFSIAYLSTLFAALLVDHYLRCVRLYAALLALAARVFARGLRPLRGAAVRVDRHHRSGLRQIARPHRSQRAARARSLISAARSWSFSSDSRIAPMCAPRPCWSWRRSRRSWARCARLQVLFVTVDPERDTPDVLRQYVPPSIPRSSASTATPRRRARCEGVQGLLPQAAASVAAITRSTTSAGTYMLDPNGRLRLFAQYGAGAQVLLHDIRVLLREARSSRRRDGLQRKPGARRFRATQAFGISGCGEQPFHFRHRLVLDLADALGGDAEFVGELVQRRADLSRQPACFDNAAAARVERAERFFQAARYGVLVFPAARSARPARLLLRRDRRSARSVSSSSSLGSAPAPRPVRKAAFPSRRLPRLSRQARLAIASTSDLPSVPSPCLRLRRLKKSLRCALVVAILTMRQLRRMNSWISARIQCTAKDTSRTPRSGSKRFTAFMRPMLPSWIRSACGRP